MSRDGASSSRTRTRCSSPSEARPSSTWSATTRRSRSRSWRPWAAARRCCSGSRTAPRARRSSRSGFRRAPRLAADDDRVAPPTAPRRGRWCSPTWPTCSGRSTWAAWASTSGPTGLDDPEHADELRIDLDPHPGVDFDDGPGGGARGATPCSTTLGIDRLAQDHRQPGLHVYVRLQPRWTPIEVRAAAVAVARELERRRPDLITAAWWKEERGGRVFVDFNQNAPHKTVFGAWSVRARAGRPGVDAVRLGRARDRRPRRADDRDRAGAPGAHGDPWAGSSAPAVARAAARAVRARPRRRPLDAPWPPVYPKMPGEPPRVAPSRARKTGASRLHSDARGIESHDLRAGLEVRLRAGALAEPGGSPGDALARGKRRP